MTTIERGRSLVLCAAAIVTLPVIFAGCGGAQPSTATPPQRAAAAATARLTIVIPAKSASAARRAPKYISPATQSMTLNVMPQGSSTPVNGYPQTVNLTPTSTGCSSTLASTQCAISLALAPGNYVGSVTTYDQTGAGGNVLSAAQAVPFSVNVGVTNTIAISLGGVATALSIVPDPVAFSGSVKYGLVLPSGSAALSVFGVDADGNYILGVGAPTVMLTSSDSTVVSVGAASPSSPNRFMVSAVASTPSAAQLVAALVPANGSGGSPLTSTVAFSPVPPLEIGLLGEPGENVSAFNSDESEFALAYGSFAVSGIPTTLLYDAAANSIDISTVGPQGGGNADVFVYSMSGSETGTQVTPGLNHATAAVYDSHNQWRYFAGFNSSNGQTVVALNAAGTQQTLSGTFSGYTSVISIAFDPQNNELYFATNNGVLAYDENGNRLSTPAFASNTQAIAYGPQNGWLYTVNVEQGGTTGKMLAYDANGNLQSAGISGLDGPLQITYNPGSGLLYILNTYNNTIVAATQSGTVVQTETSAGTSSLSSIP